MKAERMMKWRVRRQSKCSSNSEVNEDVRRSLEILDNVLAEFEDHDIFTSPSDILVNGDDEQGTHLFDAHQEKERWEDENGNKLEQSKQSSYHCSSNGDLSSEFHSLDSSLDGNTSQYPFYLDESRRCSAPPVPKRSPGTRLSNRDRPFLHKEDDEDESSYIHKSHRSLGSLQLISSQNGDLSRKAASTEGKRKVALSVPTPPGTSSSSSPVDDNGQISNRLRHKQIKNQQCLEFYLVRNGDDEDAADDDVFLSPPRRDVKCKTITCRVCGSNLDRNTSTPSPTDYRFSMDATKSSEYNLRYVMLEKKFAKVKVLLKTNQITGLDKPPPSFKPPPPPISHKKPTVMRGELISNTNVVSSSATWGGARKGHHDSEHLQRPRVSSLSETRTTTNGGLRFRMTKSDTRDSHTDKERFSVPKTLDGQFPKNASCTKCESKDLDRIASDHSDELKQAIKESKERRNNENVSANISPADVLCQNCINKGWTFKSSEFVPHSPSPLKRPPLGLSYSMEDDLSPGIKEIVSPVLNVADGQSDSVMSSPKSSPVAHMSTFSHSASSLGDGSSQSDLDFSTSVDSGKVPLTSIKSLTLPTDMKLGPSPFYSDTEGEHINGTETKLGVKSGLEAVRSSSAPPPPQDKGNWKKDKTRFIRKEEQNENDAVDSSHQDEGEATADEKPKKRSVWKSILRRK